MVENNPLRPFNLSWDLACVFLKFGSEVSFSILTWNFFAIDFNYLTSLSNTNIHFRISQSSLSLFLLAILLICLTAWSIALQSNIRLHSNLRYSILESSKIFSNFSGLLWLFSQCLRFWLVPKNCREIGLVKTNLSRDLTFDKAT